jgi:hypothetical protein
VSTEYAGKLEDLHALQTQPDLGFQAMMPLKIGLRATLTGTCVHYGHALNTTPSLDVTAANL